MIQLRLNVVVKRIFSLCTYRAKLWAFKLNDLNGTIDRTFILAWMLSWDEEGFSCGRKPNRWEWVVVKIIEMKELYLLAMSCLFAFVGFAATMHKPNMESYASVLGKYSGSGWSRKELRPAFSSRSFLIRGQTDCSPQKKWAITTARIQSTGHWAAFLIPVQLTICQSWISTAWISVARSWTALNWQEFYSRYVVTSQTAS